jgi:hypothetical protein
MKLLRSSDLFDENYYRSASGIKNETNAFDLILHYFAQGEALGLQPNPLFVPAYYATQLDRQLGTANLLAHYIEEGWRLGLRTHPLFDTAYYVTHNPDVLAAGVNPLRHFLASGGKEGRRPHPLFHSWNYMHAVPGLLEAAENPLVHYLRQGWREGRNPHPLFDNDYYLSANSDLARADVNPLLHFVTRGLAEGRRPNPLFCADAFKRGGSDPARLSDEAPIRAACLAERPSAEDHRILRAEIARRRKLTAARQGPASGPVAGPIAGKVPGPADDVRIIAFYLPQFHPIAENDQNWGAGFTEWTNVRRAVPNFTNHDQPRRPSELGYYDLRNPDVMVRQAELAQAYGVHGFCYYWYWFNGKKPLVLPLEQMLASGRPVMPFCLCWANEGWTRKWAGGNAPIFSHHYSDQDDREHAAELARYMRDPRYIRVSGAPLLLIYRAGVLPNAPEYLRRWRAAFHAAGIGEVHFALVESAEFAWAGKDPTESGFDSAVEFPPHGGSGALPTLSNMLNPAFKGAIFDYRETVLRYTSAALPSYPRWRTVMAAWDNTARYQDTPAIFMNATPGGYRAWLESAIIDARATRRPGERLVFVNAWNEWGEGTYLEPDARWGRAYLEATRDALADADGV